MIKFLIHRPIAVSMTFLAILMLGVLSMRYLPVSLMPNINIPEITVQVNVPNTAASKLENENEYYNLLLMKHMISLMNEI